MKFRGVPILVGISGNMDFLPEDETYIEEAFVGIMEEIRKLHPDTEVVLLNGMAKGIDALVCHICHERGYPYMAMLPMPVNMYEEDFQTESECSYRGIIYEHELDAFRKLSSQAVMIKEGPYHDLPGGRTGNRTDYYVDLGHELAEVSDYLIGFMHPDSKPDRGGTRYVVDVRTKGNKASLYYGDILNFEMPYKHAVVVKIGRQKIGPLEENRKGIDYVGFKGKGLDEIAYINELNRKVGKRGSKIQDPYSGHDYEWANEPIKYLQTMTDMMSIKYSKRKSGFLSVFFALAGFGLVAFELFGIWSEAYLLLTYVSSYILLLGIYFLFYRKMKYHEKYTEFRTVAELLRVYDVWKSNDIVASISRKLPLKSRETMGWIIGLLQSVDLVYGYKYGTCLPEEADKISMDWMSGQLDYYKKKRRKHSKVLVKMERTSNIIFAFSLVLLLGVVGVSVIGFELSSDGFNLALASTGLSTALAALYAGKVQVTSFNEMIDRYRMMERVYGLGLDMYRKLVEEEADEDKKRYVVELVGCEALNEFSDWLYFQRDREGKFFV